MKFRIVENADDDLDFEQLKEDYLNPKLGVKDICQKHSISSKKYYRIKPRIVEETGVEEKPRQWGESPFLGQVSKHIYKDPLKNSYRIQKTINGKKYSFGSYKTYEDAEVMKLKLIAHDWDIDWFRSESKEELTVEDERFDEFKKDYLEGFSMKELLKKYNLSRYNYFKLSTLLKQELGLSRKPQRKCA